MKTLVLIRHGKSSWEYDVSDRERPLKNRGINDIALVSKAFKAIDFNLDFVYSSPANRALNTCKLFMTHLGIKEEKLLIVEDLYDFGGQSVINFIKSLDDNYKNIIIFGHNHAFTSISNIFGDKFIDNLPTSGLVMIEFEIDNWKSLQQGKTKLTIFPKQFKND
ncbi:histidine phosphatase family protein [Winogradskyella sp. 3972H.M.0a.05]|uniref:SixA phosphatase family protein n=1 Tax=Winogradskyella sp. 3972H.M.0a.05 TaxID=2950277 RepID=UPI003391F2A3